MTIGNLLRLVNKRIRRDDRLLSNINLVNISRINRRTLQILRNAKSMLNRRLLQRKTINMTRMITIMSLTMPTRETIQIINVRINAIMTKRVLNSITRMSGTNILITRTLTLRISMRRQLLMRRTKIRIIRRLNITRILRLNTYISNRSIAITDLLMLLLIMTIRIQTPTLSRNLIIRMITNNRSGTLKNIRLSMLTTLVLNSSTNRLTINIRRLSNKNIRRNLRVKILNLRVLRRNNRRITRILKLKTSPQYGRMTILVTRIMNIRTILPRANRILTNTRMNGSLLLIIIRRTKKVLRTIRGTTITMLNLINRANTIRVPRRNLFKILSMNIRRTNINTPITRTINRIRPRLLTNLNKLKLSSNKTTITLTRRSTLLLRRNRVTTRLNYPTYYKRANYANARGSRIGILNLIQNSITRLRREKLRFLNNRTIKRRNLNLTNLNKNRNRTLNLISTTLNDLLSNAKNSNNAKVTIRLTKLYFRSLLRRLINSINAMTLNLIYRISLRIDSNVNTRNRNRDSEHYNISTNDDNTMNTYNVNANDDTNDNTTEDYTITTTNRRTYNDYARNDDTRRITAKGLFTRGHSPYLFFI